MSEQQSADLFPMDEDRCGIEATRDDSIDRYVLGKMADGERDAFLDHILFCSACNQELQRREGVLQVLADEALPEAVREKARAVLNRPYAFAESAGSDWSSIWWRAAAALLIVSALIGVLWFSGQESQSPWAEIAQIDRAEVNLQFMQNSEEQPWKSYNEGVALLLGAGQSSWLAGISFDRDKVEQAVDILSAIDLTGVPEDLQMDIAWYMIKANLMLEQPHAALTWLQRSAEIGVNRSKIERALKTCREIRKVNDALRSRGETSSDLNELYRLQEAELNSLLDQ